MLSAIGQLVAVLIGIPSLIYLAIQIKNQGRESQRAAASMHNSRAYTKVDANTLTYTVMKDGKKVGDGKVVISADGKSRTVTETGTGKDGKQATTKAVYDKE